MARRGDPKVLRLVVATLRCHAEMTQEELGEACGMSQGQISRYESGNVAPAEKALRRIAQVARLDWPLVVHLRQFFTSLLAAAERGSSPRPARALDRTVLEPALLAVTPYLIESHTTAISPASPEKARGEAAQIWTALEALALQRRRHLLGLTLRASGSWALAERVSHESVRKAAHNAVEALELAEWALEIAERAPGSESWRARLKGYGSLAALEEATPLIEISGDTRLFWVLLFKRTNNLVHLERYREAAELLPQVHELAVELCNDLDLIRGVWLRAKVAAGLGQTEEAIASLDQVGQDFTAREMPYDAALSWLDLAVLSLKAGRTAEVRDLADRMVRIFKAQKEFAREALAALQLFCNAARQEAATVELARKVIADVEQARRGAPPLGPS